MGEYDSTLGLLLIGVMLNTYLYGIVTSQFVRYCRANFDDRIILRILLVSVFLVDTAWSALMIYAVYFFLVKNYNNPASLEVPAWECNLAPLQAAWSAFVTQMYLTWRLWRLVANRVLVAIAITLAVCSLSLSIVVVSRAVAAKMNILHNVESIIVIQDQITAWLTTLVVTDCFITASLCIALVRARTGVGRTDHFIMQLARAAIQTGLFAGICSLGYLLAFLAWTDADLSYMFAIPSGRIYTTTLLYSLLLRGESSEPAKRNCFGGDKTVTPSPAQLTSAITIYDPNLLQHEGSSSSME